MPKIKLAKRKLTKKSEERARRAYEIMKAEPGINQHLLATRMGMPRSNNGAIESVLLTCDRAGWLVSEDAEGRLYAFGEYGLSGEEFMRGSRGG